MNSNDLLCNPFLLRSKGPHDLTEKSGRMRLFLAESLNYLQIPLKISVMTVSLFRAILLML